MIEDLATGVAGADPRAFVAVGDRLFCVAITDEFGREAWTSEMPPLPELPGDFDGDGAVLAADLTVWKGELGQSGANLAADGDADGDVDGRDFLIWQRNLGRIVPVAPGGDAMVHEAASMTNATSSTSPSEDGVASFANVPFSLRPPITVASSFAPDEDRILRRKQAAFARDQTPHDVWRRGIRNEFLKTSPASPTPFRDGARERSSAAIDAALLYLFASDACDARSSVELSEVAEG